jgi:hypothetical protein
MNKLALSFAAALALGLVAGCKEKGEGTTGNALAKMSELKDKMCACKDPDCAKKVSDEMTAWTQEQAKTQKKTSKLSEGDQKKAAELGIAMGECMQQAMAVATPPAPPPPQDGTGSAAPPPAGSAAEKAPSGLPTECDQYEAAIQRLSTCDRMSKQARETLVKAYADSAEGWKKLPEAGRANLKGSCKSGADAVLAMGRTQCGW